MPICVKWRISNPIPIDIRCTMLIDPPHFQRLEVMRHVVPETSET